MERTISATEARVKFGELMQRVADSGETVIVERDGVPRVAILSIDSYKPVSYTHLDVYKRQSSASAASCGGIWR